ncbi:MAG TPA: PAS domain-containing sensor histidine kinase [Sulfuricurvum sp.]|nr:PAS domain-containing sensor histidine kinase [Sulfuricurvum sp.]
MPDLESTVVTKETIKERFNDKDLQCHYYEAIMNSTTDLIALTDGERIIDANRSMIDFCESLKKDIFSEAFSFRDFFEPINKFDYIYEGYQNKRWYESVLSGEKSDYRVGIAKEGVVHAFNLTLAPLKPYDEIYVLTLTDVTGLMGYKAALEEGIKSSVKDREKTQFMLRQYDKAIEAATLVYKCDLNGIITYANKALSEVFLYGYGELVGKHISIFRGPHMSDAEYSAIWENLKKGKIYRGVLENADKLGGIHYSDVTMVPIHDREGNVVEFLSLRHEITEVIESKLEAIKTLEEKSKFFDQVSHELRTPLNAIINFTDQALESFDEIFVDEESRDLVKMYLERSHKNSQQLLHLINSLLDMAKLRSGKGKYEMVSTDIIALTRDIYESTSGLNTKVALEYLLELPEGALFVQCDVVRLRQILLNLISNAIKFTEWGYVQLRVKEMGDSCWIEIEDTGIGIPEDKMERIFEPFEQVGAHDQGTGLGLGIVNEYAKGMGMALNIVSTLGGGSCFTLQIPLFTRSQGESEWSI